MSMNINSIRDEKSYVSNVKSKQQHKNKETQELQESQKSQKKKQIISQKEAEYYCTYIVGEKGEKILLSKVPIAQVENQNNLQNSFGSDKIKSCADKVINTARTALEFKQVMHREAEHKENIQEMINILKGDIGISKESNKNFGY